LVRREIASGNFAHAWTGIKKDPASPLSAAIQYMAEIFPNASQPQVGRLPDYEDPKIGR